MDQPAGHDGAAADGASASSEQRSDDSVIEVRDVGKRFGARQALTDVSFDAKRGELLAVIGPNGAGKTTLLSILAGVRSADSGDVSLSNDAVGWVPQQAALYRRLTVEENLRLFAHLERVPDPQAAAERMLAQTGLDERRSDQVGELSGGNQQRINIAIGLLCNPQLLLLDEPSAGLDPRQRQRLWEFVLSLAEEGTTVVFTTHDLGEAERYGERLLVLADGENVFEGSTEELHRAVEGVDDPGAASARTGGGDFETAFVTFLRQRGH
ncbi:MAG: ABC transporter ATP-binding protein [Solirubrobacterales bacterium]